MYKNREILSSTKSHGLLKGNQTENAQKYGTVFTYKATLIVSRGTKLKTENMETFSSTKPHRLLKGNQI